MPSDPKFDPGSFSDAFDTGVSGTLGGIGSIGLPEKFEYLIGGSVIASWQPTNNGDTLSFDAYDAAVIPDRSSGSRIYRYVEGVQTKTYSRNYRMLTATEKTNFLSFLSAIRGRIFRFTDYGNLTHDVYFSANSFRFLPRPGERWDLQIELREELRAASGFNSWNV